MQPLLESPPATEELLQLRAECDAARAERDAALDAERTIHAKLVQLRLQRDETEEQMVQLQDEHEQQIIGLMTGREEVAAKQAATLAAAEAAVKDAEAAKQAAEAEAARATAAVAAAEAVAAKATAEKAASAQTGAATTAARLPPVPPPQSLAVPIAQVYAETQ